MNGNNNNPNPKGGYFPNQNPQQKQGQGQQKPGQPQGQPQQKQGQPNQGQPKQGQPAGEQTEQKKHGWCAAHKGPKAKCNCQ